MANLVVNLHEHTVYSLLDGLARIPDKVAKAKELGQESLAITDHGWMAGVPEFDYVCRSNGIRPIIGSELYISEAVDHTIRKGANYHQTLLAMNQVGYNNLIKLSSEGYLRGFYKKPRVSKNFLSQHSEGIICLSGCMASELSTLVLDEKINEAVELARWYREVFGDRYYIELQHHCLPDDDRLINGLLLVAKTVGIETVVSGDGHYVNKEDASTHQVLLCVQTASTLSKPAMSYGTEEFFLRSYEEYFKDFGHIPRAIENTVRIAERCEVTIQRDMVPLPHPPLSIGQTPQSYLKKLLLEGLIERYGNPLPENVIARVKQELPLIQDSGFSEYFLLIYDIIRFCRENNIVYGVRGSVGGSIVSYGLHITDIDPLYYDIVFERFMNPARIEKPDIDFDVQDDRRHEIIQYIRDTYGEDKTVQILALGSMGARATIRDVGRVLEKSYEEVDRLAKLIPYKNPDQSAVTIKNALERVPEFVTACQKDENLLSYSLKLEGIFRQASTHAAGIIISSEDITNTVPVYTTPKMKGVITTQFTKDYLDGVGLTKIDILGLTQLSIIGKTLQIINDPSLVFNSIPLDDKKSYDLISEGKTVGIFQLGDSEGMRQLVKRDKPRSVEEVAVILALYRPGPLQFIDSYIRRHHGAEKVTYPHPAIEQALTDTFGIPVYQEQIMSMVSSIAGFSPGKSDLVRKAMGKKQIAKMKTYKAEFIKGAVEKGTDKEEAEKLWNIINGFSGYGFGKGHAVAYAVMAVKSAFLKANYPEIYLSCLMTAESENHDKLAETIGEARRLGIKVLMPDINRSGTEFSLEGESIRYGLGAIKGIGQSICELIVEEREKSGPFTSILDFCNRFTSEVANKRTLESFIKSGAFDEIHGERNFLLHNVDTFINFIAISGKAKKSGQMSLFGEKFNMSQVSLEDTREATTKIKLSWERELLGTFLSMNPLELVHKALDSCTPIIEINPDGGTARIGGIISDIRLITTKKGDRMAFAKVTDLTSTMRVIIFPRIFSQCNYLIKDDSIAIFYGKLQRNEEAVELIADSISAAVLSEKTIELSKFQLTLDVTMVPSGDRDSDNATFRRIVDTIRKYPGEDSVTLYARQAEDKRELFKGTCRVDSLLENALRGCGKNLEIVNGANP